MLIGILISVLSCEQEYEKDILDMSLNNTCARHVYVKLGFKKLRIKRNSWHDQLGRVQSSVDYDRVFYPSFLF